MNAESVKGIDLKAGMIISVNTGYRPLDDEWLTIKEVKRTLNLFSQEIIQITFEGTSDVIDMLPEQTVLAYKQ